MKSLRVRVLYETEVREKELYDIYEYQGVKVFISKELKVSEGVYFYQKTKIPFVSATFGIKGVEA